MAKSEHEEKNQDDKDNHDDNDAHGIRYLKIEREGGRDRCQSCEREKSK